LLLFRGVDKDLRNRSHQTASQLAALSGFTEIASLIDNFARKEVGQRNYDLISRAIT